MFFWRHTTSELVLVKFLALLRRLLNPSNFASASTALVIFSSTKRNSELQQLGTIIALYKCSGPSFISVDCLAYAKELNLGDFA